MFVFQKVIFGKSLSKLSYIYLTLEKFVNGKHFSEVMKNLEMSYYLLIVSNLVLKLLIAIYIYIFFVLNIYFSISSLKIYFYINSGPHFYNYYLFFPYYFFIEIFYLSSLALILLIVTFLKKIICEMLIIIILISSSFIFFIF